MTAAPEGGSYLVKEGDMMGGTKGTARVTLHDSAGNPVDKSDELLLVADDRGQYLDASPGILRLLGYTREELFQKAIWDLTPLPREIDGLILWQEFMRAGSQSGRYLLRNRAGRLLPFDYHATANAAPGQHLSVLLLVHEQGA
jgi:PAS domain S-box-containing protein